MGESSKGKGDLNANFQTASNGNNLRGEALQATLEREDTLRMMINNSHVVLFLWKNENKWPVEFVSENVAKFGYTTEDFTSGRVGHKDIIYSADLNRVEQEFEKRVKSGVSAFSIEYRIVTKAGDVRWINERTFIQRNADGEATHFQGVVLDITKRKKSEEELEKTLKMQQLLTTAINNSPAVVFLWKNEKYWPATFVSENIIQFGYTVDDFLSQRIQYGRIIHPDDLKRVEEELERNIQKGEVSFNSEYRIFTKAGDLLWVNERTFIQREKDGKVACFQGIVLDITRRKKVEKALRKSLETQRMLKTIIDKSPTVAFLWKYEENWPVVFVSENVTQFGYSVEDFLSGNILYGNIIHRDDIRAVVESLARSVREGYDSFEMEYRIFTKDGRVRWVEERTFIQRDNKGEATHLQGIVIDVTERKEAEKMLDIQRELGVSLSTTWNLQTMLNKILDACLSIEGIDAAGIYLKDELLDQINLVAHRGLSPEFVRSVSTYRADSPEAQQIWTEKPIYRMDFFSEKMGDIIRKEKITAVAVIPMKHRGEIIGSLNFASHTIDRIPQHVRNFLESIALQAVNYIAPIRIVADLG
ncbi:MAG: PAS domain-containing protein [Methanosarcina thermophila]|uniref:histidine kinase n=3 Tax=Methanosarcina thermophila TaxID=2210 RepID=A0A1I7A5C7_METTE|nr:PAS domain-containing protein [Methanosarcina thermophila]ALK05507.1 MAG: histidine kinase [Methanosarcina sp. 795]AKB11773.1 Sensory transduction histidine kinase [Methanosarcina thermophila TM-1]AKB15031.1 Sensory transduction histidine kinase [Methanosarcina thermophila CHTI-55]SFT70138.1 PAS domain S-box-containing protein [Methanosarcina thermophila]BAW29396.1 sensory transduction histidine kinase [Methanosarcina thermophila]